MNNGDRDNGFDDSRRMADLEAIERSLRSDPGTAVNVPVVVVSGIFVALIVLSFVYSWPLWLSFVPIILLGGVLVFSHSRRPPVAPLELTQRERERVRLVLSNHGVRPAVTLVRALYPAEPSASAMYTVKLLSDRIAAERRLSSGAAGSDKAGLGSISGVDSGDRSDESGTDVFRASRRNNFRHRRREHDNPGSEDKD